MADRNFSEKGITWRVIKKLLEAGGVPNVEHSPYYGHQRIAGLGAYTKYPPDPGLDEIVLALNRTNREKLANAAMHEYTHFLQARKPEALEGVGPRRVMEAKINDFEKVSYKADYPIESVPRETQARYLGNLTGDGTWGSKFTPEQRKAFRKALVRGKVTAALPVEAKQLLSKLRPGGLAMLLMALLAAGSMGREES